MSKKVRGSASVRTGKTTLSIKEKLKVLDCAKENPKESCRTLSTKLNVGKTQITTILKHEAEICVSYATFRRNNKRARQGRDTRKLPMFCTNGILWLEDLLFQSMDQCSKKSQLKLQNDWQSLNMLISRHQADGLRNGNTLWYFSMCY